MIPPQEALQRLRDGNARFAADENSSGGGPTNRERCSQFAVAQEPFAIILGCSDSRVPAEIVFDQGLGDLFVVRVAGNIVARSLVGSVEFGAARYNVRLAVVMGHSQCGAILATMEELQSVGGVLSPNLISIVNRVRPSVEALMLTDLKNNPDELIHQAVRANVRMSANHLRQGSQLLEQLIAQGDLLVVGAEYSLETGVVDFFDGV